MSEILVSVHMITYNHEKYILKAIESVLSQKTTFRFELIVSDDNSLDNTKKIIKNYENHSSNKIIKVLNEKNQGMIKNFLNTFKKCKGKYIAFCEGDDYWTDPYKLQKQVDFLEANPEYGMVHTDFDELVVQSNKLTKNVIRTMNPPQIWQEGSEFVKWFIGGYAKIITCTVCFRKDIFDKTYNIKEYFGYSFIKMGDVQLFCNIAGNSSVKYLDDSTCLKRVLPESASHSQDYIRNVEFIIARANVIEYFGKKYKVPKTYCLNDQKKTAKKIIKSGIINRDFDILKKGISFNKLKFNLIKKYWLYLYFYLHPFFYPPLKWLYKQFRYIYQMKKIRHK